MRITLSEFLKQNIKDDTMSCVMFGILFYYQMFIIATIILAGFGGGIIG